MKRQMIHQLSLCGLLTIAAPSAAQFPYSNAPYANPRTIPPVSPYLNLFQGGTIGVNYYNFVVPALQQQATLQQMVPSTASMYLPDDLPLLDPRDPLSRTPRPTGHPTAFMNYQSFFNTTGTIGAPVQRGIAAQPQRR